MITPIKEVFDEGTEGYTELVDLLNNIPLLANMTNPKRRTVKDMPKDDEGKILVDLANPHILTDMSYFIQARTVFLTTGKYCPYYPSTNQIHTHKIKIYHMSYKYRHL